MFEELKDRAMPPKEINLSFRCTEDFRDWLCKEAGRLDMGRSEIIRSCILLGLPQIERIRGLSRIQLEDMRKSDNEP